MRLAISFLIFTILAQSKAEGIFPWKHAKALPWQITKQCSTEMSCPTLGTHHQLNIPLTPLTVYISPNGAVKITSTNGIVQLRTGLPGRPQKVWRDHGYQVTNIFAPMLFPTTSPLQKNMGSILVSILDFCSNLEGLLWILGDDEKVLTVINPANSQIVYLSLPAGHELNLSFHHDHIEVLDEHSKGNNKEPLVWSLHWLTLMPQLIQLGQKSNYNKTEGSALLPFDKL